ncbi:hypothetical protein K1719_011033 [Acacia pycnantha]|nr:hypothetical protein K1719_011033 [Acacia pycnantha]
MAKKADPTVNNNRGFDLIRNLLPTRPRVVFYRFSSRSPWPKRPTPQSTITDSRMAAEFLLLVCQNPINVSPHHFHPPKATFVTQTES